IAKDLAVSESTIFRDVRWLKQTIECDMHEQTRNLMFQRNVSLHGIKLLIFELWQMLERTQDISERMSIVDRISKLYQQRIDLLSGTELKYFVIDENKQGQQDPQDIPSSKPGLEPEAPSFSG